MGQRGRGLPLRLTGPAPRVSGLSWPRGQELRTIESITSEERGKMLNYLKITGLRIGLILNFKHAKLEFERVAR